MQLVDREVGALLKRLADEGLAENTIVFFIGDHGRCHIRGKQFLYDEGTHIPLVIHGAGVEAGATRTDLVHLGNFIFGNDTDTASLPTTGIAEYSGLAVGTLARTRLTSGICSTNVARWSFSFAKRCLSFLLSIISSVGGVIRSQQVGDHTSRYIQSISAKVIKWLFALMEVNTGFLAPPNITL